MFIVRYSEIGLKGNRTRRNMEQLLIDNIASAVPENINFKYKKSDGRIFIYSNSIEFNDILSRVFGIKSFSQAYEYSFNNIDDIVKTIENNYSKYVKNKTFAVIASRKGMHSFTSKDLEIAVGDALYNYSSGVNLKNPEAPVYIEVRDTNFYAFTEKIAGPGGLPLKSEGRGISLFSGGIDSPVATYMVMKRGMACDLLFCSLAHPSDTVYMLNIAKNLFNRYSIGYNPEIYLIDGTALVSSILKNPEQKYSNLIFKELLYQYAQNLCESHGYDAIITGESIGQVSSQIPSNLNIMSKNITYPIFRPLIGFDKEETINYSIAHNLYNKESIGEFCSLFSKNPGINVKSDALEVEMKNFPLNDYFRELVAIRYSEIDNYLMSIKSRKVSSIPDNCSVVDLRSPEDFEKWHVENAINLNVRDMNNFMGSADKNKGYVFYCKKGLNSAYAVSLMVSNDFNAFYMTEKELKKENNGIKMH
ncbi:MAG: THUMP domain-containing protein [Ferroplasma sp.]